MIVITNGTEYIYTDEQHQIQRTTDLTKAREFTFAGCSIFLNQNVKATKGFYAYDIDAQRICYKRRRRKSFPKTTVSFERNIDSEISYAEGKLPDCEIYNNVGFSEDNLIHLKQYLKNNSALIWKMALESNKHTVADLYRDTTETDQIISFLVHCMI